MNRYAELDENNTVINILVFDNFDTPATFNLAGRWQFIENERPAGFGYTFRETHSEFPNGVFIKMQPYPSWTLNETTLVWEPPVAAPPDTGINYYWNEKNVSWDLEPPSESEV